MSLQNVFIGGLLATSFVGSAMGQSLVNRSVEAIAAEQLSGSLHTVRAVVKTDAEPTTFPMDVSSEVFFLVNGTQTASVLLTGQAESADNPGSPCDFPCELGETCYCHDLPPDCECGFWIALPEVEMNLQPGDEIMVLLRPAPGAWPDGDDSDNQLIQNFNGTPIFWDRYLSAATTTPSPLGDQFFDVWVEVDIVTNYDGELDTTVELDLLINGVSAGPPVPPLPPCNLPITSTQCAAGCGAVCVYMVDDAIGVCEKSETNPNFCPCYAHGYHSANWVGVEIDPDDVIEVTLRPVPGALPELPGFDEDDERIPSPYDQCPADINGDGWVNAADLADLLGAWGPCAGCPADLNNDGEVNAADLAEMLGNWGACDPV